MELKLHLRAGILSGTFTGKLPSERDLATQHGIAYMTARRAIDALADEGLINRIHGRGTFVASSTGGFQRTGNLGVVVARGIRGGTANPFYAEVLAGILDQATTAGMALVMVKAGEALIPQPGDTRSKRKVDAVIALGHEAEGRPALTHAAGFVPVAMVNADPCGPETISVRTDNPRGAQALATYLHGLGHRRVGFITGGDSRSSTERQEALQQVFQDLIVIPGDFEIESGMAAARQLLRARRPPTAIIAANDIMALGCLRIAALAGIAVPTDLSICGFDDLSFVEHLPTPLTTVGVDKRELGAAAVCGVLAKLHARPTPHLVRVVMRLIPRGSSGSNPEIG